MLSKQHHHIRKVIGVINNAAAHPKDTTTPIYESWHRSVHQYGHNPEHMKAAMILPDCLVKQHREAFSEFIAITEYCLQTLHRQISAMGYVVMLADTNGIVVEALGTENQSKALLRAGLCQGAKWHEADNGTSSLGMVLATGTPILVHQNDHFDATHINLTCSAAPIFDSQGRLQAVLDISALRSDESKQSQHLVFQMVCHYAQLIENASFIHAHKKHWIIKLSETAEFLEVDPPYLIAVDENDRIVGSNQRFRQWAATHLPPAQQAVNGCTLSALTGFDLSVLLAKLNMLTSKRQTVDIGAHPLHLGVVPPVNQSATMPTPTPAALPPSLSKMCAPNSRLQHQLHKIAHLADTQVPVLLNGETGSGKEVLARAIHQASARKNKPFIAVNCAAIAESLIESELYGYAPNSFSGASGKGKTGLIQAADGGTLFLDEIGDMPLFLQSRLLRVLSEREVLPVGSTRAVKVDIRIISATHCDLQQRIAEGKFREDLYYRLNGARFHIPPLRERDDFDYVAARVLKQCAVQLRLPEKTLSAAALALLRTYPWPGNVRQLNSILEVACITTTGNRIEPHHLPDDIMRHIAPPETPTHNPAGRAKQQILSSKASLLDALATHQWNITGLARSIGISRMTLYRYSEKYGIQK